RPPSGDLAEAGRSQERGFAPRRQGMQPSGLAALASDLRDDLAGGDPERAGQARRAADGRLHGLGHAPRLEEVTCDLAQVEVTLVEAGSLHRRHDLLDGPPDGARVLPVEAVPRAD